MNVLGMGPMELLLIVVLALIVFGPAKLPEIMGQVGKAIGDFRRATSDLSDEFNRTIQAELQETRAMVDDAKSTLTEAKTSLADVHSSVNSAVTGTPAPQRTAVPAEALPAPNGVGTIGGHTETLANGSLPAAATPPLAEAAKWSWETAAPAPPSTPEAPTPAETSSEGSAAGTETTAAMTEPTGPRATDTTGPKAAETTGSTAPETTALAGETSGPQAGGPTAAANDPTAAQASPPGAPPAAAPPSSHPADKEHATRDDLSPPY